MDDDKVVGAIIISAALVGSFFLGAIHGDLRAQERLARLLDERRRIKRPKQRKPPDVGDSTKWLDDLYKK